MVSMDAKMILHDIMHINLGHLVPKPPSESVESLLLTPKENKLVVHTLGKGKKSVATAVAQLYLALSSDRTQWTKLGTGVVCLVKDKQVKSFFIRLLDIKEKCVVWEQELYKQFKYRAVSRHFQTFFAHDCRAGLNFADAEEAASFRAAVMERVNVFKKKRDEIRQRKLAAYQQQQQMNYQMNLQAMQNPYFRMQFMPQQLQNMMLMQMRAPAVAANQKAQLQAMFNSMPPEARQAFLKNMKSGGSMGSMTSMHGQPGSSMSAGMLAGQHQSNFAVPGSASGQVPHHPHAYPSAHHTPHASHENAKQFTTFQPPPPEITALSSPGSTHPAPLPPGSAGPPAAPPPAPAGSPTPPPPPPPPTFAPPPPAPASGLASAAGRAPSMKSSGSDDRGGLLQSIQAGTKLKKVGAESSSRRQIPKVESHSMRGALARALNDRAKVLGDDDDDDDDDEWDDDDDDDWSD